jgi:hypothetical protein
VLSYRIWTRRRRESETRGFIALVCLLASGLLALAILLQTLASFIIPRCFG